MYIIHLISINLLLSINFILIIPKIIILIIIILISKQSSSALWPTCIKSVYLRPDGRPWASIVRLMGMIIAHVVDWLNPAQMVHNIPHILRQQIFVVPLVVHLHHGSIAACT